MNRNSLKKSFVSTDISQKNPEILTTPILSSCTLVTASRSFDTTNQGDKVTGCGSVSSVVCVGSPFYTRCLIQTVWWDRQEFNQSTDGRARRPKGHLCAGFVGRIGRIKCSYRLSENMPDISLLPAYSDCRFKLDTYVVDMYVVGCFIFCKNTVTNLSDAQKTEGRHVLGCSHLELWFFMPGALSTDH